ncbi:MAG TPA: hypothetical protein VFE46_12625 [Pirellulales bacterium]|jgi:hypothetical protein|nr:hypothetical protein [Pirellulales bacterium]
MIERGSFVAIMPSESSPAADVLEIASVLLAGNVYVQLIDGRMFASTGGKALNTSKVSYIVPATEEHRTALREKNIVVAEATL